MNHVPGARRSEMAKNLVSKTVALAVLAVLTVGLSACGSSHSKALGPIPGTGSDTNCTSKPTTSSPAPGVNLSDYNHTCRGPAILSAYQTFISKFDAVFDDPFGNGNTPSQELGQIYQQILHGQYPQTSLPPGCTLNTSASTPQSLPAACQSLVDSTAAYGPLAYATSQLSQVATDQGVSHALQAIEQAINAGTPAGALTEKSYAVIREYGTSGAIPDAEPNPNNATEWSNFKANTSTLPTSGHPTAGVWSCVKDTLLVKSVSGSPVTVYELPPNQSSPWFGPGETWAYTGTTLVEQGETWKVAAFGFGNLDIPAIKGDPCGAGF
jgi:hypothetical protein